MWKTWWSFGKFHFEPVALDPSHRLKGNTSGSILINSRPCPSISTTMGSVSSSRGHSRGIRAVHKNCRQVLYGYCILGMNCSENMLEQTKFHHVQQVIWKAAMQIVVKKVVELVGIDITSMLEEQWSRIGRINTATTSFVDAGHSLASIQVIL